MADLECLVCAPPPCCAPECTLRDTCLCGLDGNQHAVDTVGKALALAKDGLHLRQIGVSPAQRLVRAAGLVRLALAQPALGPAAAPNLEVGHPTRPQYPVGEGDVGEATVDLGDHVEHRY